MKTFPISTQKFLATGVGSLPHLDKTQGCQFILDNFKDDIIFWPQLVKRSFLENMYVQFSSGLPGVVIDEKSQRIYIDTEKPGFLNKMEETLKAYSDNDLNYFCICQEYACGFFEMLKNIKDLNGINYFKGQTIGPISFGLTIKDQNSRPVIYNKDLQEILTETLAMKARWQIRKIKNQKSKLKIIIFIDEPYLVSIGSSYVSLKREEVVSRIDEVVAAIHQENALAGIHCCGNTDWGLIMQTQIDILNFDAYNFLDTILLYPKELESFFKRGGILAWGIVPNSDVVNEKSLKDLLLDKILKVGCEKDMLKNQVIITPSCGCGTLNVELAEDVHKLTVDIAHELNDKKV
ncbi:MAG: hypothetical protein Q8O13_05375 [Candidatus Omnitrophota bacterium]|nr:hypothetical protein [Candidatus Omnitrophota bacterium]